MSSLLIDTTVYGLDVRVTLLRAFVIMFSFLGLLWYFYQIAKGEQILIRSAWFLILALDVVGVLSQYKREVFDPQLTVYTVGAVIVVLFSIKNGEPGITRTDKVCAGIVLVAIVFMLTIPTLGLIATLTGFTAATWPLVSAAIFKKHREALATWVLMLIGSIIGIADCLLSGEDGNLITVIWFSVIQISVIAPVIYHHGIPTFRKTSSAV